MARKAKKAAPEQLRVMLLIALFGASILGFLFLGQYLVRGGFRVDAASPEGADGVLSYSIAERMFMALGLFSFAIPLLLLVSAIAGARRWSLLDSAARTTLLGGLALLGAAGVHLIPGASDELHYRLGGAIGGYAATRLTELFGSVAAGVVIAILALLLVVATGGAMGLSVVRGGLKGGATVARGAGIAAAVVGGAAVQGVRGGAGAMGRGLSGMLTRERNAARDGDEDEETGEGRPAAGEGRRAAAGPAGGRGVRFGGPGDERDLAELDEEGNELEEDGGPPRIVSVAEALGETRRGRRGDGAGGPAAARDPGIRRSGSYTLPSLDLLEPPSNQRIVPKDELLSRSELLEGRLREFGVESRVVEVHPGPIITRFELQPARGVKVSQIANLADDLALGLRAQSIRIIAPIPGKGTVGVEIPNDHPGMVSLVEVLGHDVVRKGGAALPLALGKDTSGQPRATSLDRMPHLLIAGSTGSGKSVCINALLVSLLATLTPDDVRLILIDPKRLELSLYNGIPHLLNPVVTEPKQSARILRWAVGQMDIRYRMLAQAGVRDIGSYNRKVTGQDKAKGAAGGDLFAGAERLPYIVIVVDELADLMLSVPGEIEDALARLAQMARAVGIHLVLATQRPSVDVITGVIKANFPSRIAFKVPSKTDSRTILDANGAESLLGRGDMLFLEGGRPEAERIHGCLVTAGDVERVCDHWRAQAGELGEAEVTFSELESDAENSSDDELFPEAARLVITHQQGSASLLQRRLKVGYSRASRLIDMLEAAGVVGPFEGSKAREVLVNESYLERFK